MRRRHATLSGPRRGGRKGTILVIAALMAAVLVAMVGVVLDGGQLMLAHRQAQNAADAAATAAAYDLLRGKSNSVAVATATTFAQDYNGLTTATLTVNIPSASGPYVGNSRYVETIVSYPVPTHLIQVLGGADDPDRGGTRRRGLGRRQHQRADHGA